MPIRCSRPLNMDGGSHQEPSGHLIRKLPFLHSIQSLLNIYGYQFPTWEEIGGKRWLMEGKEESPSCLKTSQLILFPQARDLRSRLFVTWVRLNHVTLGRRHLQAKFQAFTPPLPPQKCDHKPMPWCLALSHGSWVSEFWFSCLSRNCLIWDPISI